MTEAELLQRVKNALGITGNYQDETIKIYLQDIREYMLDAGVPAYVVDSTAAVGAFVRGVADLWNYGSGSVGLSPYFKERVIQMEANANAPSPTESYLPIAGGAMQGDIDMSTHKITNLAAPTAENDAATKAYVDQAAAGGGGDYLPRAGGTMGGDINMGGNDITNLAAQNVENPPSSRSAATVAFVGMTAELVLAEVEKMIAAIPSPVIPPNDVRVVDFVTLGSTSGAAEKIMTNTKVQDAGSGAGGTKYDVIWYLDIFPDASDIADNLQYTATVQRDATPAPPSDLVTCNVTDNSFLQSVEFLLKDKIMTPSAEDTAYSYVTAETIGEMLKAAIDGEDPSMLESWGIRAEKVNETNTSDRAGERLRISLYFNGFSGELTFATQVQTMLEMFKTGTVSWRITYKNTKSATAVVSNDDISFTRT